MLTHSTTWLWDEVRLGPQAWRDPRSGWDVDRVLDVLALVTSGLTDASAKTALIEHILPRWSLLDIDQLHIDADGALRPTEVSRVDGELLAWILESVWGRTDTVDQLLAGWTLARIREDGHIAQVCVPLMPSPCGLALVACTLAGEDREHVMSLVSRMTWLTALAPDSEGHVAGGRKRSPLSDRQHVILRSMSMGLTNRQIASRINFSESTVRMESIAIYRTYGVHSRSAAVAAARAAGHLDVGDAGLSSDLTASGLPGQPGQADHLGRVLPAARVR